MFAVIAALLGAEPPVSPASGEAEAVEEIVVTARRGKCRVQLAERILSEREFAARSREWAQGKAVRVVSPPGAGYRCLARIAFRLSEHGVRLIQFVDRPDP